MCKKNLLHNDMSLIKSTSLVLLIFSEMVFRNDCIA